MVARRLCDVRERHSDNVDWRLGEQPVRDDGTGENHLPGGDSLLECLDKTARECLWVGGAIHGQQPHG
jgi:hypothetical protein